MRILTNKQTAFPDPHTATPDGLVAIGGDLSVPRLLAAYRAGIFPWSIGPTTWWSPDPRGIFELDGFRASRSLLRTIRRGVFQVTRDRAFRQVMEGCASPTRARHQTWISAEFIDAYNSLHNAGAAHSVECWLGDELVGGVYGVSIGGLFAGESMFHTASDASKVALYHLVNHLRERGFGLLDIQMVTDVTGRLGAVNIPRAEYLDRLAEALALPCEF